MIRAALLVFAIGCAPKPHSLPTNHPAHPQAPTGRLAGPPPALRTGVVEAPPAPPPPPPPAHKH